MEDNPGGVVEVGSVFRRQFSSREQREAAVISVLLQQGYFGEIFTHTLEKDCWCVLVTFCPFHLKTCNLLPSLPHGIWTSLELPQPYVSRDRKYEVQPYAK